MIRKLPANLFKHIPIIIFLLALILNACGTKPADNSPKEQPATMAMGETASVPSPTAVDPKPTATSQASSDTYPAYLSLTTKPDVSPQTINGVTVAIDWAYVDESRIAVEYTVRDLDWPDNVIASITPTLSSKTVSNIGFGAVGWSSSPVNGGEVTGMIDQELTFDAIDVSRTPVIDLQLAIPVDGTGAVIQAPPSSDQSQQQATERVDLPDVGTFHFEFEIPVYKEVKLMDLNQTVEANGVAMTLKSLALNPSRVDALFCFQMPSAQDWHPNVKFRLGNGKEANTAEGSSLFLGDGKSFSLGNPERCEGVGADLFYEGNQTSVTITIPKLITSVPETITEDRVNNANRKLAEKGIVLAHSDDPHNPFVITRSPDGATNPDIYPLIWEALADWHEGPWVFTVNVNP